jgi:hypothetical protein
MMPEGGFEVDGVMAINDKLRLAPDVEDIIISKVKDMVPGSFSASLK